MVGTVMLSLTGSIANLWVNVPETIEHHAVLAKLPRAVGMLRSGPTLILRHSGLVLTSADARQLFSSTDKRRCIFV